MDAPKRIKKMENNRKDNDKLKQARKELHESGCMRQAQIFVRLMVQKYSRVEPAAKARMPWKSYLQLSEAWFHEGHDCRLPPIVGLHILLREMSSKMKK